MPTERRAFLLLLLLWTVSNLLFVVFTPYCLVGDEAQYWDWSRRLALGYYSKPPLIAYLIAGLVAIGGDKEWVIRLGPVLFSSGTLTLVYALTVRIAKSERAGLLAALTALATPLFWAGSVLMTPDAPLVFFWALALYAFHRAVHGEPRMWYLTGLALGLGMLSKYTMALLVVAFVLYLVFFGRAHMRTKGPYWAGAMALLPLSGVLYWNWRHDWASLRHTARIGALENPAPSEGLLNVLEFLGGQAGVVSPILFALMLWAMVCGVKVVFAGSAEEARSSSLRAKRSNLIRPTPLVRRDCLVVRRLTPRNDEDGRASADGPGNRTEARGLGDAAYLLLGFAVLFLFYLAVSFRREPEANWAACAYLAAIPALAWQWESRPRRRWARVLLGVGLALGALIGVLARTTDIAYALGSSSPDRPDCLRLFGLTIPAGKDPTNRLYGPREVGEAVSRHLEANPDAFLFSDRYQLAAQLAFYTEGRPQTYCANLGERRLNQYDLWGGWHELTGRDGLFVVRGGQSKASGFVKGMIEQGAFRDGQVLETLDVLRGNTVVRTYTICLLRSCSGYDWTPPDIDW